MDSTARCSTGLIRTIKLDVRLAIVLIAVRIELGELALRVLALTETGRGMEDGIDVGDFDG
jgi:hypothetical protein